MPVLSDRKKTGTTGGSSCTVSAIHASSEPTLSAARPDTRPRIPVRGTWPAPGWAPEGMRRYRSLIAVVAGIVVVLVVMVVVAAINGGDSGDGDRDLQQPTPG